MIELDVAAQLAESMPEQLGYIESEELQALRAQIEDSLATTDTTKLTELVTEYSLKANALLESQEWDDHERVRLGQAIAIALLWERIGRIDKYAEDVDAALWIASGMYDSHPGTGYEHVADVLRPLYADAVIQANALREKPMIIQPREENKAKI